MEKLKNLVNPGSKKDDEVMYGSGRSDDPVHTEGSPFGGSRTAKDGPLSTSSNPAGASQYDRGTTTGASQYDSTTGGASHGLSEPYASRMPGGFDNDDAATTASVSSGVPGQSQSRSARTGANDDPIFTDKPLPPEPASGTGFGQSSLTGNSYPDRSVGNGPRAGDEVGSSHRGRDAALGAGAVETGTYRHGDHQRDDYAPETGRSFPLGGSSASDGYGPTTAGPHSSSLGNKADPRVDSDGSRTAANTGYGPTSSAYGSGTVAARSSGTQSSLGRDALGAGAGAGTAAGTGYGPESWQHEHQHHGHQYEGDPCQTGEVGVEGGPHFVSGPHVTDTANRLDPHLGSGIGGAGATGDPSGHHHSHHGHRGEEAALSGGTGAAGLGSLEADRGQRSATDNTTSSEFGPSGTDRRGPNTSGGGEYGNDRDATTGVSSTGKTAGPHKSDMLNKLDPRVDSDLSKQQGSHDGDSHYGRDAALMGAGGAGLYEAEKHHRGNEPNLPTSSNTSGADYQRPYRSGIDTGVDPTRSGMARDEFAVSSAGSGHQPAATSDHHYGKDAGLAGAGGVGGPHGSGIDTRVDSTRSGMARDESAVSSAGSGHQPAATSDHHYKTDAGLAGVGGIGAYEADKHLGTSDRSDLATTPQDRLAGSGHQPALATGSSPYPSASYDYRSQPSEGYGDERDPLPAGGVGATYPTPGHGNDTDNRDHSGRHTGRDAALVGGAGAGALVGHEYSQRDAAGHGTEPYQGASREHHAGRDAAVLGGATGAGGLAGHEYSKKEAEELQKEHAKQEKALEKEHSKEVKHHNKELAKEQKAHEKAVEKSEKKHEKAVEKDEKKHEKAVEKDEKKQEHGEKKHGGLLGFLHRDKPDKEQKEDEARGQAATHPGHGEGEMAAGAGATGRDYDPLQGEHGSQSGVHDTPIGIGSGLTTHDAYGAHDSGHNKLHKDPPAKVRETRGYEVQ